MDFPAPDSNDYREQPEDCGFAKTNERIVIVKDFVSLNGKLISDTLGFNKEAELVPVDMMKIIESGLCVMGIRITMEYI